MKKWILEQTEIFEKNFKRLIPNEIQEQFKKQIMKLSENPYSGQPLNCKFLREKKIKKWRIYYSIYDVYLVLYLINVSNKKLQQKVIDKIKSQLGLLKQYIELKYGKKSI